MRYRDQIRALGAEFYEWLRKTQRTPDEVAARDTASAERAAARLEKFRAANIESRRKWDALQDQRHQHELDVIKRKAKDGLSERGLYLRYRSLYRRWVRRNG